MSKNKDTVTVVKGKQKLQVTRKAAEVIYEPQGYKIVGEEAGTTPDGGGAVSGAGGGGTDGDPVD